MNDLFYIKILKKTEQNQPNLEGLSKLAAPKKNKRISNKIK